LISQIDVHAMAHITGGGLVENLPRVMPENTQAKLYADKWQRPAIFDWIQSNGNISNEEMLRTFNCGIGMTVIVSKDDVAKTLSILKDCGETAWEIGHIESSTTDTPDVTVESEWTVLKKHPLLY